mgnify:CR=1 FL=1
MEILAYAWVNQDRWLRRWRGSVEDARTWSLVFSPKVRLDPELHRKAEKHALALGYSSLDEFVSHLLEREMEPLSAEDKDKLDNWLKGIGYL